MDKTVTITLGDFTYECPVDLATLAGFGAYSASQAMDDAKSRLAQALSEGKCGQWAIFRAIALRRTEAVTERQQAVDLRIVEARLQAARLEQSTAILNCRAAGVDATLPV